MFSNYNNSILFGDSDILNLHHKLNDSGIPVIVNSTVTSGNILCTAFIDFCDESGNSFLFSYVEDS